MATYSSRLRVKLIDTGDEAGTWGTSTNTNLGTILEDSIAGLATVSVTSASQALTAVNGAADQSRMAVLRFTTSLATPFNIYAPPVSKLYIIFNDSVRNMTLFNGITAGSTVAAGASVSIPAGQIVGVWSDGTNFRPQINGLITSVNPSFSGTMTMSGNIQTVGNIVTTGDLNTTGNTTTSGNVTVTGRLTAGNTRFAARVTSGYSVGTSPGTTLTFNSEEFDFTSSFNPGAGVFTAPVTGYYDFHAVIPYAITASAGGGVQTDLLKNSSTSLSLALTTIPTTSQDTTHTISRLCYLTVGETVSLRGLRYGGATAVQVVVGASFTGRLVP